MQSYSSVLIWFFRFLVYLFLAFCQIVCLSRVISQVVKLKVVLQWAGRDLWMKQKRWLLLPNLLCMHPKHWLAPNEFPIISPDAELGTFCIFSSFPDHLTWKLLLWSSVSMLRITELRELKVLFSVKTGQREIYGNCPQTIMNLLNKSVDELKQLGEYVA